MLRVNRTLALISCACLAVLACQQENQTTPDLRGSIVKENVYKNPAIGMTITLPGSWHMLPQQTKQAHPDPDCRGPLCGNPEIDVGISTEAGPGEVFALFLSGYRLSPQYLDRERYPLRRFAEAMMAGSLAGSGLVAMGGQTPLQLDGKPAYRLLAARAGEKAATTVGYVAEANGYVFLLVGSARSNLGPLQSAIEGMKLAGPTSH